MNTIKTIRPEIIFNLAAQSYVLASFNQPVSTSIITGVSTLNILESILHIDKKIRLYNAATSEMFGNGKIDGSFNELDKFAPASPYAASKLFGYWMVKVYRESYGIFASNGILFNHESEVRGLEFVTRKITNGGVKIKLGLSQELILGHIKSRRDWGYAPEYTNAMQLIMNLDEPDDFVVATGETHSVKEFLTEACNHAGLNFEDHLVIDKGLLRPLDLPSLKGNFSKVKEACNWNPKVTFSELVKLMVDKEIERWKMVLEGRTFPWDAPNYPSERELILRNGDNGR
jgi:GDPmannose 4,6-dehydratase